MWQTDGRTPHDSEDRTMERVAQVTRSSADADKPARHVYRSVKITKHSTIPYVRYSFRKPYPIYRMVPLSMTLSDLWPGFQGHDIFEVEYRKNKVTIAQEETIPNIWNGTMFGDLDWPVIKRVARVCQHQLSFFYLRHALHSAVFTVVRCPSVYHMAVLFLRYSISKMPWPWKVG